ncbi:MAG: hypothetical protein HQL73_12585, partial [Magnetococcales bacterium]|nr:hypothetical protein [Magnetococcales bacterium]
MKPFNDSNTFATEFPSDTTMTVQQVNVVINRLLQLSLEPLTLSEYLNEVIFVLVATPWLPVWNKGAIFLWNEKHELLQLAAHVNLTPDHLVLCQQIAKGQCLCGQAALTKQIILSHSQSHQHTLNPP